MRLAPARGFVFSYENRSDCVENARWNGYTGTIVITGAEGRSYSWKSAVRSGIHTNMSE